MQIISKIWLLGGWFYLSLLILVSLFYFKRKLGKKLDVIVVTWAALLVLFVASGSIIGDLSQSADFWQPIDKKLDIETKGQAAYAVHLKEILPENAQGCLYFSLDIQTWYLQNQLYPRRFNVIEDGPVIKNCGFLISQFRKRTSPNLEELDNFGGNYLYRIKSNVF